MFRNLLISTTLLLPNISQAQQCQCDRVIPYSGTYRMVFEEKTQRFAAEMAEVVSVDESEPGARINMTGRRGSAELECSGAEYFGRMKPIEQAMILRSDDSTGPSLGGLRMGASFRGPVIRPGVVHSIPNEPNMPTIEFTLVSESRQATPLMCERIEESIESAKAIQAAYSDPELIRLAEINQYAARNPGVTVQPELPILFGRLDPYESSPDMTYTEMVQAQYKLERQFLTSHLVTSQIDGIAGTNSRTCEIYHALPRNRDGTCRPEIELVAIAAHEAVHANRCNFLKDSVVEHAYHKWSNHPSNASKDETEAYQAALDILEPWYEEFCGG